MESIYYLNKCPKRGLSTKLTDWARRSLTREAIKRSNVTPGKLESSTEETWVFIHRTIINYTLHRTGLYGRAARKKSIVYRKK